MQHKEIEMLAQGYHKLANHNLAVELKKTVFDKIAEREYREPTDEERKAWNDKVLKRLRSNRA